MCTFFSEMYKGGRVRFFLEGEEGISIFPAWDESPQKEKSGEGKSCSGAGLRCDFCEKKGESVCSESLGKGRPKVRRISGWEHLAEKKSFEHRADPKIAIERKESPDVVRLEHADRGRLPIIREKKKGGVSMTVLTRPRNPAYRGEEKGKILVLGEENIDRRPTTKISLGGRTNPIAVVGGKKPS